MNRKYGFSQVDAFTQKRFSGNPCAVILDADDLSDAEMLSITREMNLSETSFVLKPTKSDFKFRYFTPSEEIPLAGHPTIATVHRLIELGRIPKDADKITIELKAGLIEVYLNRVTEGILIGMRQLAPKFLKQYSAEEIMPLFGLTADDLLPNTPIQTVSTGTPMLMIPLKSKECLETVRFDAAGFSRLRQNSNFFSAHLFSLGGFSSQGHTAARHFCPPPDVMEDPFTGSATGAMGCYLWNYNLLRVPEFVAEQGHNLSRPGHATVRVLATSKDIEGVEVSGFAVTTLVGELLV